jgi:hypothetical protein
MHVSFFHDNDRRFLQGDQDRRPLVEKKQQDCKHEVLRIKKGQNLAAQNEKVTKVKPYSAFFGIRRG